MSRGDPTYAHIDVDWPEDPRSRALTPKENWLYEICVLCAVRERVNCLSDAHSVSFLCRRAAVRRQTMESLLRKCAEISKDRPIIWKTAEGRICIPSMGKRHPKLYWKGEREGPWPSLCGADTGPISSPRPSVPSVRPPVPPSVRNSNQGAAIRPAQEAPGPEPIVPWMLTVGMRLFGSRMLAESMIREGLAHLDENGVEEQRTGARLLVMERRKHNGTAIEIPAAYWRDLCKQTDIPDWALEESKRRLRPHACKVQEEKHES